ncbi:MAG: DCC1-like thiol-disulfide oxidoreductase family protein [Alphaproteobacteria bacterium]
MNFPRVKNTLYIVYDNECPFCRHYTRLVRVRAAAGDVQLINARAPSTIMDEITAKGIDIDHGMVVKIGERLHHGADAIHILALLGTRSGAFNRITYWLFQSPKVTAFLYPALRTCRNLVLWGMRIPKIKNLRQR